ncbi:rhamnan synthesis F family protein [Tateyamaria sp. Alg231-49]|uniref:rhamnan synthesis F family protein n=1 Tax=Tateyamaria sp. Alg231-49 TaxID=1922219 RepID=UPI00131F23F4|nr:rhamnan synthesis F family protein [Tateyamaria sp. Alg231-49]
MTFPPAWKIKRELFRFFRTLRDVPRTLIWYLFATPYYEFRIAKGRKTWQGKQTLTDRIVVLVIYPSHGLPESTRLMMQHIHDSGYSMVVVSNLPLPPTHRETVLNLCATYIERPNFGYDFGAYRDGMLYVTEHAKNVHRLALLNDSAWYPLPEGYNWLKQAEDMGPDLVGAISNYGVPRIKPEMFQDVEWTYSTKHRNFHYCSFALSFGPAIYNNPKFTQFWKGFAMDNNKARVVRRGEIGLTQWVIKSGYSHDCTCNPQILATTLDGLSDDRLDGLAHNLIFPEHPRGMDKKMEVLRIPREDPEWRVTLKRLVFMAASTQGMSYALADLNINELRFPFLKKSPLRLSRDGSDVSLRLIQDLPGDMGTAIRAEAEQLRRSLD